MIYFKCSLLKFDGLTDNKTCKNILIEKIYVSYYNCLSIQTLLAH